MTEYSLYNRCIEIDAMMLSRRLPLCFEAGRADLVQKEQEGLPEWIRVIEDPLD